MRSITTHDHISTLVAASLILLAFAHSQINAATQSPSLVFNSDGVSNTLSTFDPPMTLEQLLHPINELSGTSVDVYAWCPNCGGDTFSYMTTAAEVFGTGITQAEWDANDSGMKQQYDNIAALHGAGIDSPAAYAARAQELGMDFWVTLRMNDTHEDASIYSSKRSMFKRNNPGLLLESTWAFDYGEATVRQRELAIIQELCTNYDLDGFELDFQRGNRYFRYGEAAAGISLMTDFMENVRAVTQQIAQQKGRDFTLAVRVPQSFDLCLDKGLDVESWINQGLVDVVTPMDSGYLDMNADVSAFVEAAQGTNVKILGGLEIRVNDYQKSNSTFYAAALSYQQEGADGTYLFNFDCGRQAGAAGDYTAAELQLFNNLNDKANYETADKYYFVTRDQFDRTPQQGGIMQLPAAIAGPGNDYSIAFTVGDDLAAGSQNHTLRSTQLQITLSGYNEAEDQVVMNFNGSPIAWSNTESLENGTRFVFNDLQAALGENVLTVSLDGQSAPSASVGIEKVEYYIDYGPPPPAVQKSSADFAYKYEFGPDLNPTNSAQVDEDANGFADWANMGSAPTYPEGVLRIASASAQDSGLQSRDVETQLWPNLGLSMDDSFSFEFRSQVLQPIDGKDTLGLLIRPEAGESMQQCQAMLQIGPDGTTFQTATGTVALDDADNTDGFHVFRLVKEAGNTWWIWRDGELLTISSLEAPLSIHVPTVYFGDWGSALSGTSITDYLRLELGAFSPTPNIPGDANLDGFVNADDAAILAAHWLMTEGVQWSSGDFNSDGKVNDADAALLAANWLCGVNPSASVPEPAMLLLISSGVFVLFTRRRIF